MLRAGVFASLMIASPALAGNFVFSSIDSPNVAGFQPIAISDADAVVGGADLINTYQGVGFTWVNGVTTLVTPPDQTSNTSFQLVGVNVYGFAVGDETYLNSEASRGFVYDLNTAHLRQMGAPPG